MKLGAPRGDRRKLPSRLKWVAVTPISRGASVAVVDADDLVSYALSVGCTLNPCLVEDWAYDLGAALFEPTGPATREDAALKALEEKKDIVVYRRYREA